MIESFPLAAISFIVLLPSWAVGQKAMDRPPDGGNREVLVSILIPSIPDAPFSAIVNTESIRQLPNFQPPRSAADARRAGSTNLEDLGKQSINGVETVGTRETVVIDAGKIGNDSPLEIQREYWYSPQLGVNLLSRLQDPRIGIQNFEVSDITRTEPDRKLFKASGKMKIIDLREGATKPVTPANAPKD